VIAVGEHVRLERQERAARVDQVDARQQVVERDLLGADVLLHRQRVVRPALHGRVVGDHHHRASVHGADAGHDARARRIVVVETVGSERRQLEECGAGIEQTLDALAHEQLAARGVSLHRLRAAALLDSCQVALQFLGQRAVMRGVGLEFLAAGIEMGLENVHGGSRGPVSNAGVGLIADPTARVQASSPGRSRGRPYPLALPDPRARRRRWNGRCLSRT
jgi:hypothetical protein